MRSGAPDKRRPLTLRIGRTALSRLATLDQELVGTPGYLGIGWFWSWTFRHYLRNATLHARVLVHDAFLREGLELAGDTLRHHEIVLWICTRTPKRRTRELYEKHQQCLAERAAALKANRETMEAPDIGAASETGHIPTFCPTSQPRRMDG